MRPLRARPLFLVMLVAFSAFSMAAGEKADTSPGASQSQPAPGYWKWAPTPPMGWNSWDCFGTTVTEAQAREQADFMAEKLKPHGWEYLVVDIQWYEPVELVTRPSLELFVCAGMDHAVTKSGQYPL